MRTVTSFRHKTPDQPLKLGKTVLIGPVRTPMGTPCPCCDWAHVVRTWSPAISDLNGYVSCSSCGLQMDYVDFIRLVEEVEEGKAIETDPDSFSPKPVEVKYGKLRLHKNNEGKEIATPELLAS